MTSFSVGGVSDEATRKRLLESGYIQKWKPRKISAIRDFPPGCGPNAPNNLKPEKTDGGFDILESGKVDANDMDGVAMDNGTINLVTMSLVEADGRMNSELIATNIDENKNVNDFEPNDILNSKIDVDCWSHCINSPIDVEIAKSIDVLAENVETVPTEFCLNVDELPMDARPYGVEFPVEVECQKLEAFGIQVVLDNSRPLDAAMEKVAMRVDDIDSSMEKPITEFGSSMEKLESENRTKFKESDELLFVPLVPISDAEEAKAAVVACNLDNELPLIPKIYQKIAKVFDSGKSADERPLLSSTQYFSVCGSSRVVISDKPLDKYLPRRVSGIRDFPPGCGPKMQPIGEMKECVTSIKDMSYLNPVAIRAIPDISESDGKEIVIYSPDKSEEMTSCRGFSLVTHLDREVVHGLAAAPFCTWDKGKAIQKKPVGGNNSAKVRKQRLLVRKKKKKKKVMPVAKKSSSKMNVESEGSHGTLMVMPIVKKSRSKVNLPEESSSKSKELSLLDESEGSRRGTLMITEEVGHDPNGNFPTTSTTVRKTQNIDISLPPFVPTSGSHGDARNRVRETLRLFHTICRKLLQKEEANFWIEDDGKIKEYDIKANRIDLLSAKVIREKGKEVNTDKLVFGQIPGVEVGDEFQYRVELAIVGIHRLYQAGIDYLKVDGQPIAVSIVASGAYSDGLEDSDVLIYSGQGGNIITKGKQPEDQKLERGNLALSNCISRSTPVRVVRGWKETKMIDPADTRPRVITTYVYDGLYTVKRYWSEPGSHGKQVFMFELRRNPGQPELAWKELKSSCKSKIRPGICISDISGGNEPFPICAINIIDNEKPSPFNYTCKMIYPDWYSSIPPVGCNCTGRCSNSKKCSCSIRNGGEIPYNHNGAIVEAKPLVFECGPSCKCPPSCYNRVTQRGIKLRLEIFKTELRGWGLRSIDSIPSGSFICEYAGELLEDREAEQRVGSDEYLFDIGQNYGDSFPDSEEHHRVESTVAEAGFTIDAGRYGNIGRFVNHSCSPNLYSQNVLYDHEDERMSHVMLFAAENIPRLQELTYHYNYSIDQVRDSDGNIKIKKCYCGAAECKGRLY